jgi:RimJ/RimL family protein N-acetyltransferase
MKITFKPLRETDFSLLLKWLEAPHVKSWWDQCIQWTPDLIQQKYGDYVKGYKLENGVAKPINAYIICLDEAPIGYIQSYNAYDFARSKPLNGLPSSLAAFDMFIGEENYLKRGIGSKALVLFLKKHCDSYTHIFADPESVNLAAIRAYEKAGFKKTKEQPDTGEVWMIREQPQRPDPLHAIQKLIQERYSDARAVFWAGSVSQKQGTSASDLDLVVVFDTIPNAYREAFIYEKWPIDAFVHDADTLRHFFEESRAGNGISGLIHMILNGREVTEPSAFSESIKILAKEILKAGPAVWDKQQIDKERFLITDVLDDIKCPASRDEQIASAAWLFEALGQFYFRSQNKWCASGKSIVRYLKNENPNLALEFIQSFESLFQIGNTVTLESLVRKILTPYGGLFWDGFTSDASKQINI